MVPFQGAGSGIGALSWGQRELWDGMRQKHTWMPIGAVMRLPVGTTLDDLVADLRYVMGRYHTMRTRLRLDPDGPKQVVAGAGEIRLEVVDVADHDDPAAVAERVRRRYWNTDYDFAADWPVRMAVVRHRGVPTHRVWVMCHLVTDAAGVAVILSELAGRAAATGAADPTDAVDGTGDAMPPLAQARWQGSPAGQRQCARVLRYWEGLLRGVPARRFPDPADRPRPRYWSGTFTSPATRLAVRAIAARTGVASASVLLAVFAVALARVTGVNPVVTRVVVSNRFRPGLARTVSPVVQNGLCVIDVAGITLDQAVTRTRRRAMTAYKYAYYDPPRLDELIARVCRERGETVDLGCFFNDRRPPGGEPPGPVPTPAQVREALPGSTFRWDERQDDQPYDSLFLTVDEVPEAIAMSVFTDTHRIAPAGVEACVREMEALAVAAAFDPAVPTRVGPPGSG
jgi:hypothetical protein